MKTMLNLVSLSKCNAGTRFGANKKRQQFINSYEGQKIVKSNDCQSYEETRNRRRRKSRRRYSHISRSYAYRVHARIQERALSNSGGQTLSLFMIVKMETDFFVWFSSLEYQVIVTDLLRNKQHCFFFFLVIFFINRSAQIIDQFVWMR